MTQDTHKKLVEIIRDFDTAMLVTRKKNGDVHARPMRVAKFDDDMELYFVTSSTSTKISEIGNEPDVTIIFQDNAKFVNLTSTASIVKDRKLVEAMWSEAWKVWFPKGKNDPDICIVKTIPKAAEYWDNEGLEGLSYAFAAAKAYIKGERPVVDSNQHGKMAL
jgi:general stress protein 26